MQVIRMRIFQRYYVTIPDERLKKPRRRGPNQNLDFRSSKFKNIHCEDLYKMS